MSEYYDRQSRPVSSEEWQRMTRVDKRVAETVLPSGYWVSTVYMGLNHRFGPGAPLIFETMVFPCDTSGQVTNWGELDSDRYSTEAEALAGHAAMSAKWTTAEKFVGAE